MSTIFGPTRLLLLVAVWNAASSTMLNAIEPFSKGVQSTSDVPPSPSFDSAARNYDLIDDPAGARAFGSVGYHRVWCQWSSENPTRVRGRFELRGSDLFNFRRLGTAGDEVACLQASSTAVDVDERTPRQRNGFVFESNLSSGSVLSIELVAEDGSTDPENKSYAIPLTQLGRKRASIKLPGGLNLEIKTEPSPPKLIYNRRNLIFSPGETFRFEMLADEVPRRPRMKILASVRLHHSGSTEVVATSQQEATTDALGQFHGLDAFEVPLPEREGAYELDLQVSAVNSRTNGSNVPLSRRKLQLLVFDGKKSRQPEPENESAWKLLKEIQLKDGGSAEVADQAGSQDARNSEVAIARSRIVKTAFRVEGLTPGQPHIAEFTLPGGDASEYVVALFTSGRLLDTNHPTQTSRFRGLGRRETHVAQKLVFWPESSEVQVHVQRTVTSDAKPSQLRIFGGRKTLPRSNANQTEGRRSVVAHLRSPLPDASFKATYADPQNASRTGDWNYFLTMAERQTQWLEFAGYSAAMLTVAGDGGAIYPSDLIEPSVVFDPGEHLSFGAGAAEGRPGIDVSNV
ncbi:MAG: hypothetical protein R3C05_00185 [Pirellulaceae bacterium]